MAILKNLVILVNMVIYMNMVMLVNHVILLNLFSGDFGDLLLTNYVIPVNLGSFYLIL